MPSPDRVLRRLVTDLAGLHPEDLAGVLDGLDGDARAKVEALLREFAGPAPPTPQAEPIPPVIEAPPTVAYDVMTMSPWLAGLLRENSTARNAMAPDAFAALCDCAAKVHPIGGKKSKRSRLFSRRRSQGAEQVPA